MVKFIVISISDVQVKIEKYLSDAPQTDLKEM